jgi:hypothetical protein
MQTTNTGYAAERPRVDGSVGTPAEVPLGLTEAERAMLERHKPILRFDRQYDYRAASVLGAVENRGNLLRTGHGELVGRAGDDPGLSLELLATYPNEFEAGEDDCLCLAPDPLGDARSMEADPRYAGRLYGRVVPDMTDGRTWLQYWFWLYYNPKNLFGFGKHEGDWEMVQVGLGKDDQPEVATYAQHTGGEARAWRNVQVEQGRPVVYVASLSHASYFREGTHPYPVGIDHAYGDGPPQDDLPVEPFGAWVDWMGRWGSSERAIGRGLGHGPRSPRYQGDKWERPGAFHAKVQGRRVRGLLRSVMHLVGYATYPKPPRLRARREGERHVVVEWELDQLPWRRSRHLYLTVHDGERVVASRTLRGPGREDRARFRLPTPPARPEVWGSTFNRLRQRSELTAAPVDAESEMVAGLRGIAAQSPTDGRPDSQGI